LLVLLLVNSNNIPAVIENNKPGAGCALIYCGDIFIHG